MTCVLSPTSLPQAAALPSMRWSPMTSTADIPAHSTNDLPSRSSSYGGSPTGSVVYRKSSSGNVKKRASRAGTRSVNTLSAAQLERKRANDREAQRAIRQRTKDHIDTLEKALNDVKQTLETREKLLTATHARNRELEDENAVLRLRLNDVNSSTSVPTKYARAPEAHIASAPQSAASEASGPISQRSGSISHGFNLNNGAITNNVNGAWQQSGFTPANGPIMLHTNSDVQSRSMTGWRARDSPPQAMSATAHINLQGLHPPQTIPYTPNGTEDRSAWSNQYEFGMPAPQQTQHFPGQPTAQQQQQQQQQNEMHYGQAQNSYQATPQQAQTALNPPLLPPQADFSQAFYQYQAQGFPAQPQYQATNQSTGVNFSAAQPSPVSIAQYHNGNTDHNFTQHIHPPMQFRDEAELRVHAMAQFPPG